MAFMAKPDLGSRLKQEPVLNDEWKAKFPLGSKVCHSDELPLWIGTVHSYNTESMLNEQIVGVHVIDVMNYAKSTELTLGEGDWDIHRVKRHPA